MNLRVTIIDEAHDNKIYNLTFPGSHTVVQVTGSDMKIETHASFKQVKRDVATVTDIPVFRQSWTGDKDTDIDVITHIITHIVNFQAGQRIQTMTCPSSRLVSRMTRP